MGPNSTYMEQVDSLGLRKAREDPRETFTRHLCEHINQWKTEGEHIILCFDTNENLQEFDTSSFTYSLNKVGMKEAIVERHQQLPPNTYFRGKHHIDGIFLSSSLTPINMGF